MEEEEDIDIEGEEEIDLAQLRTHAAAAEPTSTLSPNLGPVPTPGGVGDDGDAWMATAGFVDWSSLQDMDSSARVVMEKMIEEDAFYLRTNFPDAVADPRVGTVRKRGGVTAGGRKQSTQRKKRGDGTLGTKSSKGGRPPSKRGGKAVSPRGGDKVASHNTQWTAVEHKLFEDGLAVYGKGNWKAISAMIGTRTATQVKNHARQFNGNATKSLSDEELTDMLHSGPLKHETGLSMAESGEVVKIERLHSDADESDVEIDIVDSDNDTSKAQEGSTNLLLTTVVADSDGTNSGVDVGAKPNEGEGEREGEGEGEGEGGKGERDQSPEQGRTQDKPEKQDEDNQAECAADAEDVVKGGGSGDDADEDSDDEPAEERALNLTETCREEMDNMTEFFCGNPHRTPDRYLKIRNHIYQMWLDQKPKYLTKTFARAGLIRECGDVNVIGRVHDFLESKGYINFGAERPRRKRAAHNIVRTERMIEKSRQQVERELGADGKSLLSGPRRRKVRSARTGRWIYEDEIEQEENFTQEHQTDPEDEDIPKPKKRKSRSDRPRYDPFRLVTPRLYDSSPPFYVQYSSHVSLVIDFHAHLASTEIIGLIGGRFHPDEKVLELSLALPCRSLSTGVQCEMDPISEMEARHVCQMKSLEVVGWYHSHPRFAPNPSVRDVENQSNYQQLFARQTGEEPFLGIIVTPYDSRTGSDVSQLNFIFVSSEVDEEHNCRVPYELPHQVVPQPSIPPDVREQLHSLFNQFVSYPYRVSVHNPYRKHEEDKTCLDKMVHSLRARIHTPEPEAVAFLDDLHKKFSESWPNQSEEEFRKQARMTNHAFVHDVTNSDFGGDSGLENDVQSPMQHAQPPGHDLDQVDIVDGGMELGEAANPSISTSQQADVKDSVHLASMVPFQSRLQADDDVPDIEEGTVGPFRRTSSTASHTPKATNESKPTLSLLQAANSAFQSQ